ncbi:hypothetical protein NUACC26_037350 [Scytonema sp. NUACC26]
MYYPKVLVGARRLCALTSFSEISIIQPCQCFFSVGDLLTVNLNPSSLYTLKAIEIEYLFFLNCFLENFYKFIHKNHQ